MKFHSFLNLFACFLISISITAQESAKVLDFKSKEPLAFVNVVVNNTQIGVSTDIDGKFSLPVNKPINSLTFSYIGYQTLEISYEEYEKLEGIVLLRRSSIKIKEVEILPGINPAHRIIDLAIENRKINNPEKATEFYYESYNKLIFTANLDSAYNNPDSIALMDSADLADAKFFESQYAFMMESITERNHIPPDHTKEVVIASRISGLKNPIFSLIGTQLQSFSLYKPYIELFGNAFLSPISIGSTSKYLFVLEDTLYQGKDTVFSISFRPRRGKNFDALKGVLSINTNGYAIQNFIAEPTDQSTTEIKIQQKYEFLLDKQWFPVQLNTTLVFNSIEIEKFKMLGIGKSYIKNVSLQSKLKKSKIGNTILKIEDDAGKKDEAFWNNYREDTLGVKEQKTYHFMDSIGREENLDKKIMVFKTLIKGSIPYKIFDFPIDKLFDYNGYEGFRLGLGIETNEKLYAPIRLGGYFAYGFKDKRGKYGTHLRWTPKSERQFETKFSYKNDVVEFGGTSFYKDKLDPFSTEGMQKLFIQKMDGVEQYQAEVSFRALRDYHFSFFGNTQERTIKTNYAFIESNSTLAPSIFSSYDITEIGVNVRFSFREKFAEMFGVKLPVITKFPVVQLRYTKGIKDLLNGDFDYNRIDLKIDKKFTIRNLGQSAFRIQAGLIDNTIPLSLNYRSRGTAVNNLYIATDYSIETAHPNEFFSDRYVSVFYRHSFKELLFKTKKFEPELVLVNSFTIGDMTSTNNHFGETFNTLEKGYLETGIQLNKVLKSFGIGVGAFYRYGANHLPDWEDNVRIKLTSSFVF